MSKIKRVRGHVPARRSMAKVDPRTGSVFAAFDGEDGPSVAIGVPPGGRQIPIPGTPRPAKRPKTPRPTKHS